MSNINGYQYWFTKGVSSLSKNQFQEAIKHFKIALNIDPRQKMVWITLGGAYIQSGKLDKGISATENILKFNLDITNGSEIVKGFFEKTPLTQPYIEEFEKAFDKDYEFYGNWEAVGSYYASKEDYEKAIKAYTFALEQHPNIPMIWFGLATLYYKTDDFKQSKNAFKKALKLKPDFKNALAYLGLTHVELNEIEQAEKILERLIEMDPLFEKVVTLRLKIQEKRGDTKELDLKKYQGINLRADQKEFLVELEKKLNEPIPPLVWIDYDDYKGAFGFVSRSGYITELGLDMKLLHEIPESIGNLKYLRKFSMTHCVNLEKLPNNFFSLQHLEKFRFQFTPILEMVSMERSGGASPEQFLDPRVCYLSSLRKLDLQDSIITALPDCMGDLLSLQEIKFSRLQYIPQSIRNGFEITGRGPRNILKRVEKVKVETETPKKKAIYGVYQGQKLYSKESAFLTDLETASLRPLPSLPKLEYHRNGFIAKNNHIVEINLTRLNPLKEIPVNIQDLEFLERINIVDCLNLKSLSEDFGALKRLKIFHLFNCDKIQELPNSFGDLDALEDFWMHFCRNITTFPESFGKLKSLKKLHIRSHSMKSIPESFGNLINLEELILEGATMLTLPESMKNINSLKKLTIKSSLNYETLPSAITSLENLEELKLEGSTMLKSLGEIGNLTSLKSLEVNIRTSLECLPDNFGCLKLLKKLSLIHCMGLTELPESFSNLISLEELHLLSCIKLSELPFNFGDLQNLVKIEILNSRELKELPRSFERLTSLREVKIEHCGLVELPLYLMNLKLITSVSFSGNTLAIENLINEIKEGKSDESESLNQVKMFLAGIMHPFSENVLERFQSLAESYHQKTQYTEKYLEICEYCLHHVIDPKVKNTVIEILLKYFIQEGLETVKQLLREENSFVRLKILLKYLKSIPELNYLKRGLLNRLSSHFLVIPEEAEVLLDYEVLNLEELYGALGKDYYKRYGTNSLKILIEYSVTQRGGILYYSVENGHITGLLFNKRGLTKVPESIRALSHLKYLNLSENKLDVLPDWIHLLSQLQILDLSNNKLTTITEDLFKINSLRKVIINNNPLQEIPLQILKFTVKHYTDLGATPRDAKVLGQIEVLLGTRLVPLEEGVDPMKLPSAHHFSINGKGDVISLVVRDSERIWLDEIPESIFSLEDLEVLDISESYYIHSIPQAIENLNKLKSLRLANNHISSIPDSLFSLKSLEHFDLGGNELKELPAIVENLVKLDHLNLSNNHIEKIPNSISNLPNLTFLSLDNNHIKKIPDTLNELKRLKYLYLSFNALQELPESLFQLTSLEYLSVSGNRIQKIPSQIQDLKNLKELYMMSNMIETIPDEVSELTHLTRLDLSENKLESLPDSLEKLNSLLFLDVSFNEIEGHPSIENKVRHFVMQKKIKRDYEEFIMR